MPLGYVGWPALVSTSGSYESHIHAESASDTQKWLDECALSDQAQFICFAEFKSQVLVHQSLYGQSGHQLHTKHAT
jgi:hypothetical protein